MCNGNCEQGRRCDCRSKLAELIALVKEWGCDDCNTVYPGPPQKGFNCVVCPKCGGNTTPLPGIKLRRIERELAAERELTNAITAEVDYLHNKLRDRIAELDAERAKVARLRDAANSFHRVMGLWRDLSKIHGKCTPRSDRACTACNAIDDLNTIASEYKGLPIELHIALKEGA